MKKLFLMLGLTLLTILGYSQANFIYKNGTWYPEKDFREKFGCKDDETIKECQTRMRIDTLRIADSIKRLQEARNYEGAKRNREDRQKEKERRANLTPEERRREDEEITRLKQQDEQDKKLKKTGKTKWFWHVYFAGLLSTKTGNTPNYDPVPGMQVGTETQIIPFSDDLSLSAGAAYSMQGGKYESSDYIPGGNYSKTSRTSRLNYLNFPVMIRYQREQNGFFAEAGVQPGLLLSAKDKGTTTNDIKDEIQKFDVGIPVGVGYQFKNKFGVGFRITPGLINVNKDKQYNNRNMVASLRASYSL